MSVIHFCPILLVLKTHFVTFLTSIIGFDPFPPSIIIKNSASKKIFGCFQTSLAFFCFLLPFLAGKMESVHYIVRCLRSPLCPTSTLVCTCIYIIKTNVWQQSSVIFVVWHAATWTGNSSIFRSYAQYQVRSQTGQSCKIKLK